MKEKNHLEIKDLSVTYNIISDRITALNNISFSVEKGGTLGIIGETGSGKSTLALAVMGLLDEKAGVSGEIIFEGKNLIRLSYDEKKNIRWSKIAVMFQNSLDVMNPVLTLLEQVSECLIRHCGYSKNDAREKSYELLNSTGLNRDKAQLYPHQVSGGMRQRALLAMALSCGPDLLIADEPTNALDASLKDEMISLILKLQKEKKFTLIVISHEINTILKLTSRIAVFYRGHVVEEGVTRDVISNPMHSYTRGLVNSSPEINPYRDLWGIPQKNEQVKSEDSGTFSGCPFFERCTQRSEICSRVKPVLQYASIERRVACNKGGIVTVLSGRSLSYSYRVNGAAVKGCSECTLDIFSGEVAALIGESGSGKSTLAEVLAGIKAPDCGDLLFNNEAVRGSSATSKIGGMQIIFQDPYTSINENFTVYDAVTEPLVISGSFSETECMQIAEDVLKHVELPSGINFFKRRCHTLSGGERQRIAIARALAMKPSFLIADEITSMLDSSTQANIIRLLKGLQNSRGFAMLYITHDNAIAQKIADKVYVMKDGRIINKGNIMHVMNSAYSVSRCAENTVNDNI